MKKFKNNGRLKLLIIAGTRPEIIRLSAIINKSRKYFDCLLVHTGQNYDYNLNGIFFRDLQIGEPDIYLNAVGENLGQTMGNIISASFQVMSQLKPDAILVLGDTNSCLSVIGAKRLHIPIFHMEAGNRCKEEALPEETNRKIVDVISDVNIAYSEQARSYLEECGFPKERTFVTGSPMFEVLSSNIDRIKSSNVLSKLNLERNKYILLSAHREENIDKIENFMNIFESINELAKKYSVPIIYSCHPRSKNQLIKTGFKLHDLVKVKEPMGFLDYNCLQMNAMVVISDSGTLPEESSFYTSINQPFPAVSLRTSTERPEAIDKGGFILAGLNKISILQSVETAIELHKNCDHSSSIPSYEEKNVSAKIIKIIQSYTGVINKLVWNKG